MACISTTETRDWTPLIEGLANDGYVVVSEFLPRPLIDDCLRDMGRLAATGQMTRAGVGRGQEQQTRDDVRRDQIYWFSDGETESPRQALMAAVEGLRAALNESLFLGLQSFEGHYALYPPGGFYRKHYDVFRDDDTRAVSFILYLNEESWSEAEGGQLRLYPKGEGSAPVEALPRGGTLVCFLSRDIEHEVLEARRERRSFTGWFRRRSLAAGPV